MAYKRDNPSLCFEIISVIFVGGYEIFRYAQK